MTGGPGPAEWRVKLTLHYDGAGFHGWQIQPGTRTVQREVEAVLARLLSRPVSVVAAGRTDTGVHATGQVASALVPARWTTDELRRAMNALLPSDVWVAGADRVATDFHARFDATARSYVYRIGTEPQAASPFLRRWCWPLGQALAPNLLARAASALIGEHSFAGFAKSGQPERGTRCTVYRATWHPWRDVGMQLEVTADRFLHHMVRYLVGTMAAVASGARPLEDVIGLLRGERDLTTSPPAPASGLFLRRVHYDPNGWEAEEPRDEVFPGHR